MDGFRPRRFVTMAAGKLRKEKGGRGGGWQFWEVNVARNRNKKYITGATTRFRDRFMTRIIIGTRNGMRGIGKGAILRIGTEQKGNQNQNQKQK